MQSLNFLAELGPSWKMIPECFLCSLFMFGDRLTKDVWARDEPISYPNILHFGLHLYRDKNQSQNSYLEIEKIFPSAQGYLDWRLQFWSDSTANEADRSDMNELVCWRNDISGVRTFQCNTVHSVYSTELSCSQIHVKIQQFYMYTYNFKWWFIYPVGFLILCLPFTSLWLFV